MRAIWFVLLFWVIKISAIGQTISPTGTATYCVGGAVTLSVTGAAIGSNFQWKQNGANVGTNLNTYSANANGNYTVVVTPGSAGTPDTLGPVVVSSTPKPVADFSFVSNNACSGTNIVFTSNASSGTPGYTYAWDFDDGATSTNANPVHAFTSLGCGIGTFDVKLTVTDAKGCIGVITKTVSVKQMPDVQVADQNVFSPFSNCSNNPTAANPSYNITINNISPSAGCITTYNINWGDGNIQNGVNFPISHSYTTLGAFNLAVTAIGSNGCNNTKVYVIANQSNPAGSLGTLGSTTNLCASANVPFTISNWTLNSPGTTYLLDFGDGSTVLLTHPLNIALTADTVNHLYTTSSCPSSSYTATLLVNNACASTPYTAGNIQIRIKPDANFTINATPSCIGQQVCFNNATTAGSYGPNCNTIATYSWDFGDGVTSTLENPCHIYANAGTYNVILSSTNPCGTTTKTKPVCIVKPPAPGFTLNTNVGCIPLAVSITDTTNNFGNCQNLTYKWTVTYTPAFCGTASAFTYTNNTKDTSASPSFNFTNAGTYTITQSVTNACGTFIASKTIDVKQPPTATINLPTYSCGVVTITPSATVVACTNATITYAWAFAGGTPATANTANPGAITFTSVGPHSISLAVTNECGTTTVLDTVFVTTAPDVIVPSNAIVCGGLPVGAFNFSSNIGTPNYSWTNSNPSIGLAASGSGNIPSFTAINTSTNTVIATIIVTPFVSNCTGMPDTFTITVHPKPLPPLVTTPIVYCQNAAATALSAIATAPNNLLWYNNATLSGGTSVAPTPLTTMAGSTLYYVTQTNTFNCISDAAIINVTVNATIAGNIISASQNICAGTAPNPISSGNITGGNGTYTIQWQQSINGGATWINIASANNSTYAPGILNDTIFYRRIITSIPCTDTSNVITINVSGALNNINITASQIICAGFAPAIVNGGLPVGGGGAYNYVWEKSTDNVNWVDVISNTQNYQPPTLLVTTYYRRKVNAAQCSATSNIITITVNPTPIATITAVASPICTYNNGEILFSAATGTPPFNIELVVTKPNASTDTIRQVISNTGPINITVFAATTLTGNYTISLFKITDANGCIKQNTLPTINITVNPLPVLVLTNSSPICDGVAAILTANGASTYVWSPNTNINTTTGNTVSVTPTITTTYFVRGTLNGCYKDTSTIVTVIPGAVRANAGIDQMLCPVNTSTLNGNAPSINATGQWTQINGPVVTITNTTQNNTTLTGLSAGNTYTLVWKIIGQAPCPPSTDTMVVDVLTPIVNVITNDTIICNGQSVTIRNSILWGGSSMAIDSLYTYQWQSTPLGLNNWQNIIGADSATLLVSPSTNTCYRRKVKTNAICETISNAICVTVNPTITNNSINANQQVCVNTAVNNLLGTVPNGGDGNFIYQWQTSTDLVVWNNIVNTISYQPPVYTTAGIHYFKRNVTSGNCTNTSNVVTIKVNPNAKAIFASNPIVNCAPFNLSTAISVTALPDSNGTYNWYADGLLFGSNGTGVFPGYSITNAGDTVDIKLVTISQFGCKPDSIMQQFVTVKTAVAKFIKDTARGCGPLNVTFTNTSNVINSNIQFFWNFGNGITSTAQQPGTITFNTSPFFNDTTYQISLKAYNGCDTTLWRDSVKIRSNPNARFGVVSTFGCSPFTVQISNTSLGGPNTYYWNFGNGHKDTTFVTGNLNYTYNIGNVVDTLPIQLIAVNECGSDTQVINIRIAPNVIRPQINVNASDLFGCAPHIVAFNNATSGATSYTWNFDDGTPLITTNNTEATVVHTFNTAGVYNVIIAITNGCSDTTVTRQVTVYDKPKAIFTTNASVYCLGDTIKVTNTSLHATNYRWFWGDGQSSAGLQPSHVYTIAGNYTILLRAEKTNNSGIVCYDTLVKSITVLVRPNVTLQSNIGTINCAPFTIQATAPAIINEAVTWYINDTTVSPSIVISSGISTQYTFNKPGTFTIKMVAENILGCKDSVIKTFTVRGTPIADFTPQNISVCTLDTTINYVNTTTFNDNGPLNYRWLVDGLQLGVNGNFNHRYQTPTNIVLPKIYTTQLIASNTVGCSDTAIGLLQINPTSKAVFTLVNTNACVPFTIQATNNSLYANTYKWLLNGLLVDTAMAPNFIINQPATNYTITLITSNIYGCKPDTTSVNFSTRNKPKAAFTLIDSVGCNGSLSIAPINRTVNATSYKWDWGDATALSTFANPTHLYTAIGQYNIALIASDGTCADTAFKQVNVSIKPIVNFDVDKRITCDTARIQFINNTTGSNNFTWSFSNGTTSNDINPYKQFAPSSTPYTVKLVATGSFGCKDSLIKPNLITAIVPPAADFFISPSATITVPNYTFNFNNLTLNNTKYVYQWNLADGTFGNTRDITHKYADTGNYPIQLIVLDTSTNCPDTIIKMARIDGFPGWLYVPNAICPNCIQSNVRDFIPKGKGLKEYQLQIFTTWGELVFETKEIDATGAPIKPWDGRYKGIPVQQDVYVWKIFAKFMNGSEWQGMLYPGEGQYKKTGTITVVR